MAKSTEKKEDNPKYETPVVIKLDEVDKASGAGPPCVAGSAVQDCAVGNNATVTCFNGGFPEA